MMVSATQIHTLLLLITCFRESLPTPIDPEPRIVGGVPVSANEYPWMVSLRSILHYNGYGYDFGSWCGASLIGIDPPTILTAAHCVDETSIWTNSTSGQSYEYWGETHGWLPITLIADINRTDVDERIPGDSFQRLNWTGSQMTIHPDWNGSVIYGYDIAVIIVDDQKLNFSESDLPQIPLNDLSEDKACCVENEHFEAIGYGKNHSNGTGTDTLEHTSLHFVDVDECAEILLSPYFNKVDFMDNKVVCAIGDKTDTCQGDSGGPLFRMITDDDGNEVPEIIGLTSWGDGCAKPDYPAVYTSTSHFRDWINEVTGWTSPPSTEPTSAPTAPTSSGIKSNPKTTPGDQSGAMKAFQCGFGFIGITATTVIWIMFI